MAAKPITIKGRDWYKEEREPGGKMDRLIVVKDTIPEELRKLRPVLNLQMIAEVLPYSTWTIREWCTLYERTKGKLGLKSQKLSGRWIIYRSDLIEFLNTQGALARG
jgi:hypothetical protein